MQEKLNLRFITELDLEEVMEAERLSHAVPEDQALLQPWTMSADNIVRIIKQRKDDSGSWDTRTMVIEAPTETGNPNEWCFWTCCCFCYELQEDGYELLFSILHPEAPWEDCLQLIYLYLIGKANKSTTRRKVVLYLRDYDNNLPRLLTFWKSRGFATHLIPNYFDGKMDAWQLTWEAEETNI